MKQVMLIVLAVLLMQTEAAEAQLNFEEFVQSRFYKAPASPKCRNCRPEQDGIVHIRFKPMATSVSNDGTNDKFEFTVQLRKTGTSERYLNVGGFRLTYNETVFGPNLNDPPIIDPDNFILNPAAQCVPTRGELIADEVKYDLGFADSFTDELNFTALSADATEVQIARAPKGNFSLLTPEWQDILTLTCTIPAGNTNAESDVAISGTEPLASNIREFPETGPVANNRVTFLIVDNDLRGFRLDGKTYAEDYARYGDSKGVRVKFSKGIATQLTAANFVFEGSTQTVRVIQDGMVQNLLPENTTITEVIHTAGSAYANIKFEQPINVGVLRLASTQTTVVNDVDGDSLAGGSFLAALNYDEDAPEATAISRIAGPNSDGESQWRISFSQNINTATISEEHICVTEPDGICVAQGTSPTVPVLSVASASTVTQSLTIMIDEGDGKVGGMRSLEFRRNAVLGEDLNIVEDYQTALRDAIQIADTRGANITVASVDAAGAPTGNASIDPGNTEGSITLRFKVEADENVSSLNDAASYQLWSLEGATTTATLDISPTKILTGDEVPGRSVVFQYVVPFNEINDLADVTGFTLARNGNSLLDDGGNAPGATPEDATGVAPGERLDATDGAIALRDTTQPQVTIEAIMGQVNGDDYAYAARPDVANGNRYTVEFLVTSDKSIPDLDNINSYQLTHINSNGAPTTITSAANETANVSGGVLTIETASIIAGSTDGSTTVGYVVNFDDVQATQQTRGFTLTVSNTPRLLDTSGNIDSSPNVDNAEAFRDTEAPKITVTLGVSNTVDRDGYDVSFNIAYSEPVRGIRCEDDTDDSLKLLRKSGDSYPPITGDVDAVDILGSCPQIASISYEDIVISNVDEAQATEGFTLGLAANGRLRDLANNDPVDANPAGETAALMANDPLDTRATALSERNQVGKPITVVADDIAVPMAAGSFVYEASFTVTADTGAEYGVPSINTTTSYDVLIIKKDGTSASPTNAAQIRKGSGSSTTDRAAKIDIVVDLVSKAEVEQIAGLTLARRQDLLDYSSLPPVIDASTTTIVGLGDRIDGRDAALAEIDLESPIVTIKAVVDDDYGYGAVPDRNNGNLYTMEFNVESDKPLVDINAAASYKLLHIPTDGNNAIADLSTFIQGSPMIDANSERTTATIKYTVDLSTESNTQLTRGFTLGRNGMSLLDSKSFNGPFRISTTTAVPDQAIEDGEPIDLRAVAVAERDTTKPSLTVTVDKSEPDETDATLYDLTFKVVADEEIRGSTLTASYSLLYVREDPMTFEVVSGVTPDTVTVNDDEQNTVTVSFDDVGPISDSNTSNPIIGYTLARTAGALRDLANNDPVVGTNSELGVELENGNLVFSEDALAALMQGIRIRAKVFLEGALSF